MTWDNKLVAIKYWEPRHPQDIIRPKSDKQSVPDARVDQADPTSGNEMYYDLFLVYDTQCNYDGNIGFDIGMVV